MVVLPIPYATSLRRDILFWFPLCITYLSDMQLVLVVPTLGNIQLLKDAEFTDGVYFTVSDDRLRLGNARSPETILVYYNTLYILIDIVIWLI